MNLLDQLNQTIDAQAQPGESSLMATRRKLLHLALLSATALGALLYTFYLISAIQQGQLLNQTIFYGAAYLVIVILALLPKLPYNLRAAGLLLIPYAAGLISGLNFAYAGDARPWMTAFVLLALLLLGLPAGLAAWALSTATLLTLGFLMSGGWISAPAAQGFANPVDFGYWLSTGLIFGLIVLVIVVITHLIIENLQTNLEGEKRTVQELAQQTRLLSRSSEDLAKRQTQLHTAAEISNSISTIRNTEELIQRSVETIQERFNLYYAGIFLLDDAGQFAYLRAGTGEAGKRMLQEGHQLEVGGSSMIGWCVANHKARIALDTDVETTRFNNPHLPLTRSELAIPLAVSDRVIGALTIQSVKPNAFDENDITILQSIGDSLAIALENARLVSELEARIVEVRALNRHYLQSAWSEQVETNAVVEALYENHASGASSTGLRTTQIPMIVRDQVIGTITVETERANWSPDDAIFIEEIANQAALALENTRLLEETQRSARADRVSAEITQRIWSATDIESVMRAAIEELGNSLPVQQGWIELEIDEA